MFECLLSGYKENSKMWRKRYSQCGERLEWSRIEFSLPFTPLLSSSFLLFSSLLSPPLLFSPLLTGLSYIHLGAPPPPPLKIGQSSPGPLRAPRHETNSFYYKMSTLPKYQYIYHYKYQGGLSLGPVRGPRHETNSFIIILVPSRKVSR